MSEPIIPRAVIRAAFKSATENKPHAEAVALVAQQYHLSEQTVEEAVAMESEVA